MLSNALVAALYWHWSQANMFLLSLVVSNYAEYSQVNTILSMHLCIILIAEQRIISAQDYMISQSGAAAAEAPAYLF
jgi:hypothetical protein